MPLEAYHAAPAAPLRIAPADLAADATRDAVHARVCRTALTEPGWCVLNLGAGNPGFDSVAFRRGMLGLIAGLSERHRRRTGEPLAVASAMRFDQQTTTRPHLDGGPEQSLLLLGYEPTAVDSTFAAHDLARFAADRGLTPAEALTRYNPLLPVASDPWLPYATAAADFDPATWRIVAVNNSGAAPPADADAAPVWRGVLHTAAVPRPDPSARRVVNSVMLAPASLAPAPLAADDLERFASTAPVLRPAAA